MVTGLLRVLCGFGVAPGLLAALPAAAQSVHDTHLSAKGFCFERRYDAAHLAAHPDQTVTRFFIGDAGPAWTPVAGDGAFALDFGFEVTGSADLYTGVALCTAAGSAAVCDIEGDGGQFTVEADGPRLRLHVRRMLAEGPHDVSPDLAAGDNRVLLLDPAPGEACPPA